ncbi:unnamed protein product, partial [Symbiodinium sp. CCMP2592]
AKAEAKRKVEEVEKKLAEHAQLLEAGQKEAEAERDKRRRNRRQELKDKEDSDSE